MLLTFPDHEGSTPLHYACVKSDLDCFNTLTNFKSKSSRFQEVDINRLNDKNQSPLHFAAKHGSVLTAENLVLLGAHKNLQDKRGKTPVNYVRKLKNVGVKRRLMKLLLGMQNALYCCVFSAVDLV